MHMQLLTVRRNDWKETLFWENALEKNTTVAGSYLIIPRIFFNRTANLETLKTWQ